MTSIFTHAKLCNIQEDTPIPVEHIKATFSIIKYMQIGKAEVIDICKWFHHMNESRYRIWLDF